MPNYEATYAIGQRVVLDFGKDGVLKEAYIRAIIHSVSKVRYSVFLKNSGTTLHNIDSAFIKPSAIEGYHDFGADNYS